MRTECLWETNPRAGQEELCGGVDGGHAARLTENVRDFSGREEERKGDNDSLAGQGEKGLKRGHNAGRVESSLIEERVPDLTSLPMLTSTFSTRQHLPQRVRVYKPNINKYCSESCTSQSGES